jgi:release factor glutamine methyltransferase
VTVGEALSGCGIAMSEARSLLCAASGLSRAALAAHPEEVLSDPVVEAYREKLARRRDGEPMAYVLGEREFYGLRLCVTPDVLIPRPETELLVDFALECLPPGGSVLDLGTGSGAIALAVKQHRPDATVTGVERSALSLEVARRNANVLGLDVEFVEGSWFNPLAGRRFDLVLSNPPYIASGDVHLGQGDLRFEPSAALVGGGDGLEAIRQIASDVLGHLSRGAWVAVEHGQGQDAAVADLFRRGGLASISSRPDLAGIARVTLGKYNLE